MDLDCVSGRLKSILKDQKVNLNLGTHANEFSLKKMSPLFLIVFPWLSHRSVRPFFPFLCCGRTRFWVKLELRSSMSQHKFPLHLRLDFFAKCPQDNFISLLPAHTQAESLKDSVDVNIKLLFRWRAKYLETFIFLHTWLINSIQGTNHTNTFRFFFLPIKAFKSNYLFLMSQPSLKTCWKLMSKRRHNFKGPGKWSNMFSIVEVRRLVPSIHIRWLTMNLVFMGTCVCAHTYTSNL